MRKLALLVAVCGCATVPMARQDLEKGAKDLGPPPPGAARVYVYRPGSIVGAAVRLRVFLDEAWVGDLAPSTFAVVTARPGEHKIVVRAESSAERTLVVEPGRNHYVKASTAWGLGGAGADVEVVTDERAAQADIRGCGLIADVAAESIRRVAKEIARVSLDPVRPEALVAAAVRALEAMEGLPGPPRATDLDTTVGRLRTSHPGLDGKQMVAVGAAAMAASLRDEPPEDAFSASRAIDGRCGLLLRREGRETVIARVLPDSPAALAQVEAGLELREVNGEPTRDHTPVEVVQRLASAPGTEVALTVGRPGDPDRKIVLRRAAADAVDMGTVDCRVIDGGVLYLRPWDFRTATARRVRDHGRSTSARLVILDLRDNPGGPLDAAQDLADSFLAGGPILTVGGARVPDMEKTYGATPGTSVLERARLVVLANGNTRGSAEAVVAAVQDQRRGRVLGSKTAGAARVEIRYRVAGIELQIPAARLLRANGEPLDGRGVTPDAVGDAPAPAATLAMGDVPCPNAASPAAVAGDPLVRQAAGFLLQAPDAR